MIHVGIVSWDWRSAPDPEDLDRVVANMTSCRLRVRALNTGTDEVAVAFSAGELDDSQAAEVVREWMATGGVFVSIADPAGAGRGEPSSE